DVTDLFDTYLMDLASIAVTNDHRARAITDPNYTAKSYNAYKAQLAEHLPADSPLRSLLPADKGRFGVLGDFAQLATSVGANNRGDSIQVPMPTGEARPRLPQAGGEPTGSGSADGTAATDTLPVSRSFKLGTYEFTNLNQTDAYIDKAVRIIELLDEHSTIRDYVGGRPVRITLHVRTTEAPADVTDRGDAGVDINLASYYFERYGTGYIMGMLAHEIGLHPLASRNGSIPEEEELFAGMPLTVPGLESLSTPRFMNTEGAGQADHVMAAFPHTIRHGIYRDIVVEMAEVLAQRAQAGVEGATTKDVTDLFDTYLMDLASIAVTNDHRARAITDPNYTAKSYNAYKAQLAEHLPADSPLRSLLPADKGRFGVLGDFAQLATSVGANNRGDSIQVPMPTGEARPRLPQAGGEPTGSGSADGTAATDTLPVSRSFKLGTYEFTNLNQTDAYIDKAVRIIELLDEHSTIRDYVGGRPVRITLHVRTTEAPADVTDRGDAGVDINLASYYFEKYDTGYIMGMLAHEIGLHPLASRNGRIAEEEDLLAGMPLAVPGLESLSEPRFMNTVDAGQADHVMAAFPPSIRHGLYRDVIVEMARILEHRARVGVPGAKTADVTDLFDTYLMDLASIAVTNDHRARAITDPNYTAKSYNAYKAQLDVHLPQGSRLRALLPADKGRFGVLRDFAQLATSVGTNNRGDSIQQPTPAGEARPRLPQETDDGHRTEDELGRRTVPGVPAPLRGPDRRPRFVVRSGFDARRFTYDGDPVTDLTVRVALRGSQAQGARVRERLDEGVARLLNGPGHRLPGGDRLHVTVEYVDPADSPHLTVDLVGRDRAMDQNTWWADAEPVQLVHELTHQLGLRDEYRDADSPQRPHIAGSLLGDLDQNPEDPSLSAAGLRGRHLALLGALIGDLDQRGSDQDREEGWEAVRSATAPVTREALWVDPVSLPRAASGDATGTDVPARMRQDATAVQGEAAAPSRTPFSSGNFQFTNLEHRNVAYRDKAVRIIQALREHDTIRQFIGGRPCRITLHLRTTETPADVTDQDAVRLDAARAAEARAVGAEAVEAARAARVALEAVDPADALGVDINLASYYFEKYDIGYIMGMLAHEIGLHPLASRNRDIHDEESMFQDVPLFVPGLEGARTMQTERGRQSDHIMAAYPSMSRYRVYRDIVVEMAQVLEQEAANGTEGAREQDVTDLFDTYLMDLATIAVTNDKRTDAAWEPRITAKVYNEYRTRLLESLPQDGPLRDRVPPEKSWWRVTGNFLGFGASFSLTNRGASIWSETPGQTGDASEMRPRLPQTNAEDAQEPIESPQLRGPRDKRPRFVVRSGFDARRFTHGAEPVTDLTVRVALRGTTDESTRVFGQLSAGVEEFLNDRGHRLPNGDRLHVTVELVDPADAPHLTVDLVGRDRGMDQGAWWVDAEPVQLVHELTHQLGLRDEYRDADAPHRPHVPGSLLGDLGAAPEDSSLARAGLRERHLALLGALIGDVDLHAGDVGGDETTWEAARSAAEPVTRRSVWVDPVSLPRAADATASADVPAHMPQGGTLVPFKSGNFEFTNLKHTNEKYRDKAIRIIELLGEHPVIAAYVGGRPVRITLHVRTTETPADVTDRGTDGVDINLASYYFEKYDIGYIMGMLAHEIGLHPLASQDRNIPDEEAMFEHFPLSVPGLEDQNPPRTMSTEGAGQADHIMAAYPSSTRHRIYRDIVLRMADQLARAAQAGVEGAKGTDVTDLIDTYLMDLASIALTNDHRTNAAKEPRNTAKVYNAYKAQLMQHMAPDSPARALLPADKGMFGVVRDFAQLAAAVAANNRGDSIQVPLPTGEAMPRLPQADDPSSEPVPRSLRLGQFEFTNLNQTEAYVDKAVRIVELLDEHATIKNYIGTRTVRITLRLRTTEAPADVTDHGDAGVDINLASYYFEKYDTGYIMGMLAHEIGLHPFASRNGRIAEEEDLYAGMPLPVPGLESLSTPRFMNTEGAGQADHVMAAFPHTIRHGIYRDIVVEMAGVLAQRARVGVAGAKSKDVTDLFDTYLMDLASIAVTNDHRARAITDPNYTAKSYNAYKAQLAEHLPADSPLRSLLPADKGRFGVLGDFAQLATSVGANNRGDSIQQPIPADEARPRLPQSDAGDRQGLASTAQSKDGARDRRPRFVVRSGFDARRFTHDGDPVTDLTVRVATRGADDQSARVFGRLSAGVEEFLNERGYRLPNGDRLHVTVEPVNPEDSPHLTADLVGRDRGMDQKTWWVDAEPVQLVHELTHQLGLRDEYRDADAPHRPHIPGSLLGDLDAAPEDASLAAAGLRDRHLALLGALIGEVDAYPAGQGEPSWEAVRSASQPVTRRSVWVDPVSLPRPTGEAAAGDVPPRMLTPFRSGNFEFTNLKHTDEGYRDRAVRIIDLLRKHDTIRRYIADRPCRITLHVRTTEPPADVLDRGPDGVDINLASYYFEKYDIGHVMGMLAHEIGLHPLASENAGLPDEEAMFENFPLPVPGLEDVNPPRTMSTEGAGQADHIMAAYQSSTRHRIYRDIILEMARVLAQDVRNGEENAKPQDVTDVFDCYLMDLASIAVTNDHRVNAALEPGYTARVYNAYKKTLHDLLAGEAEVRVLLPSDKSRFGVMNDFRRIGTYVSLNNRGASMQREDAT
ncbi:hypothetical protein G3M58_21505, partial [Streptomyces sp. SID7499]|nr:hypothetical protein [Streptomyces sp. SID7499]